MQVVEVKPVFILRPHFRHPRASAHCMRSVSRAPLACTSGVAGNLPSYTSSFTGLRCSHVQLC